MENVSKDLQILRALTNQLMNSYLELNKNIEECGGYLQSLKESADYNFMKYPSNYHRKLEVARLQKMKKLAEDSKRLLDKFIAEIDPTIKKLPEKWV